MSSSTLLGLIVCNIIWSANPAMSKLVLSEFSAPHTAWLRTASAFLAYVVLALLLGMRTRRPIRFRDSMAIPMRGRDGFFLVLMGALSFCFTPFTQMAGLANTRVMDNAFIVAMEPLIAVVMAWLFLRERLTSLQIASFSVALLGFSLLSGLSLSGFGTGLDAHMLGNLVLLASMIGDGSYSVISRKLVRSYRPLQIFGTAMIVGTLLLSIVIFHIEGVPDLSHMSWRALLALVWLGPLGTTASYVFWVVALTDSAVASVALTLFIQPVLGAAWGYCFLSERLTLLQFGGGLLIILAVLAQTLLISQWDRLFGTLRRIGNIALH